MATNFLPVLSPADIQQAAELIQQAYAPQNHLSPLAQRHLQQELFDIQKRPEAWGLVLPFIEHTDQNVQFFGAHTAQVKITRDWETFPQEHAMQLRDILVDITGRSITAGRNKVILRKLFVAITSLALKLCIGSSPQWPDWIISCVNALSSLGAPNEHLLDFLAIVAEEVERAELLPASKSQMQRTLLSAVATVAKLLASCTQGPEARNAPHDLASALKCLQAWLFILPANDMTPLIPSLISLLDPISVKPSSVEFDETTFVLASDTLQEVMTGSAFSDGSGKKILTEPLLLWFDRFGRKIIDDTLNSGFVDGVSHSFCKLLVGLGDHSTLYLAANIASRSPPSPFPPLPPPIYFPAPATPTKSHLVQVFLRLLLAYTALPGFYAADEEESELTLGFWYLFQEALWSVEYEQEFDDDGGVTAGQDKDSQPQWQVAKVVYSELVQVLRQKVMWPDATTLRSWPRDQRDKFQAYRRDVGDTLINAYYVLRNNMLGYYVSDLLGRASSRQGQDGWEDVEATLHCLMTIQEAIPLEDNPYLARVFGPDILGRLPMTGSDRVRRTALLLIGSYASWFTVESGGSSSPLLMNVVSYVASALQEPALCLPAANALRDLCDANRTALAPHIGAFGQLHAELTSMPDTEKSKVLQSIASVIQALSPADEIPPVEAIASPVVSKLLEILHSSAILPDEARAMTIHHLETIAGVARGLTRTTDSLLIFEDSPAVQELSRQMNQARDDLRTVKLREAILDALTKAVQIWSTDASVSDAISDVIKAITALPSDLTILSLPPTPLLDLVCAATQRQLTSVWLSLATMLIIQLDPPTLVPTTFKAIPSEEAHDIALRALMILLQTNLSFLGQPEAMDANPDIVQSFFNCMDTIAQHFVSAFYRLPGDYRDALMKCAATSLGLQERYSLVGACTFLITLINRTCTVDELSTAKATLAEMHGLAIMNAVLSGFAGVAPRSASPNLIELLSAMVTRYPAESRKWMSETLFSNDFVDCRASSEAKERFVKAVFGSRSTKRIRDAAQQFTLVARGLEGSSFGYASISM